MKRKLCEVTKVDPKKQKLIGLVRGKLPSNETMISDLNVKEGCSFMMMGRPDEEVRKEVALLKEVKDIVSQLS